MIMRAKTGKTSSAKTDRMEKKRKSGFVYTKRDPKKIHDRANQSGGQFDGILKNGIDTWRPAQGDNSMRILPPTWDGHDHYGYDVWVHQRVGVDNGSYPCLAKMQKKRCPVCEAAKESADAGEEEEAKALQATRKILVWMLDRDDDNMNPQIWILSWTMDRDIVALCESKKTGKVLYIDHPDLGYDISMKRKGQALNTRYFGLAVDRDSSPISESSKKQDEVLDFLQENPIPSLIKFYDAKYLEQIISGTSDEKDEDDDDEGEEEKKPKKGKAKRPADDEDEDEEEAPFDEDEEEEKPVKKKKKPEPDEDDDEEVEEDSDDDEVEEKPAKKRRKPEPEEDDDEEEEEEEEERPVKKKKKPVDEEDEDEEEERPVKKKKRPEPEDEDDEETEEEEEERKPVKRRK